MGKPITLDLGEPWVRTATGIQTSRSVGIGTAAVAGQPLTTLFGAGTATGVPSGVIHINTTAAATDADTNEKILWTYSLPANTLNVDNRAVRVTVFGTSAANNNGKRVRVYFNNTMVSDGNSTPNNCAWTAVALIIRTGAATQLATGVHSFGITSAGPQGVSATPAGDTTGAIVIKVTGLNGVASANDTVFKGAVVEVL